MFLLSSSSVHSDWIIAFALTIIIEMPVFTLLGRKYASAVKAAAAGVLCSCITHPLLWFAWRPLFDSYIIWAISGEAAVIAIEAIVFYTVVRPTPFTKALAISLLANATSYGTGLLLNTFGIV